ncbi:uncharacterized protein B0H64DRAFT_446811 [Chaetomium fimeti]|uniref:Zn(2)-C6 fungal-type domain-containing protein n=1 Tax=Chaetomium fimeti TaxID=1854472 RepID=A0AAE0H6S4_9PEZI|nr:hypothetical protein B0H64DRAFT_446811 [Chaetomium fimeti]
MSTVSRTDPLSPSPPRRIADEGVLTPTQPDSPSQDQPQRRGHKPVRNRLSRREQSKYACFRCQKKKTKCNRPRSHTRCEACIKRNDVCEYDVREGAVSRYAHLKQTSEQLERENGNYKGFLANIVSRPDCEKLEIFRKLGTTENPLSTLEDVRAVDALHSASVGVATIDAEALEESLIKVPARPWTSVAGDGLVSHLISDFFDRDEGDPFANAISLIDPELFVRDMALGDPSQSDFCSPFLVNTICGLRSMFSDKIDLANEATGTNLTKLFVAQAKQHFEIEADKRCLKTVQGLYLFFLLTCHITTNRAGSMYRLAALEQLGKLEVEKVLTKPASNNQVDTDRRRAMYRTYWGIFNFEWCVMVSSSFFATHTGPNVFGPPAGLGQPPVVSRISALQYRAVIYNNKPRAPIGDEMDMRVRQDLLFQLNALETSLSPNLRYDTNPNRKTTQIKIHLNMVAYNILRPLPSTTPILLQTNTTPPTTSTTTAKALLLALSACDIHLMHSYLTQRAALKYTPALVIPLWSAVFTLVPFLDDPETHDMFARGCALLEVFERDMQGVRTFRRGILAVAWKIGVGIPDAAAEALAGLEGEVREGGGGVEGCAGGLCDCGSRGGF